MNIIPSLMQVAFAEQLWYLQLSTPSEYINKNKSKINKNLNKITK